MTVGDSADAPASSTRAEIAGARRVVVKIGSSALTSLDGGLDRERLDVLADVIEARMRAGSDLLVVSSGAVSAGLRPLGLTARPRDLATKQAAASVGQAELAKAWAESFARHDRTVGQVLLTAADIGRRETARNAQRTIDRLRQLHALPIINENDTTATAEIRFGDNDRLAALVAHLVGADALILLSDVDALYTCDPRFPGAEVIREIDGPDDLDGVIAGSGGALGTGGMASKLAAARLASDSGIPVLLTSAEHAAAALGDAEVGTAFSGRSCRLSARRFWVRHAADAEGVVAIDAGAVRAVTRRRRSLLPAGIVEVEGDFRTGDVVEVIGPGGIHVGRGVVAYDAAELRAIRGFQTADLPPDMQRPVIHADDLVT